MTPRPIGRRERGPTGVAPLRPPPSAAQATIDAAARQAWTAFDRLSAEASGTSKEAASARAVLKELGAAMIAAAAPPSGGPRTHKERG
jgi:hypothetical protein